MAECKVVIEFRETPDGEPYMRWERSAEKPKGCAFTLLGRAFEISRRECDGDFHEAMAAFLRGAMIEKEDLAELLARLDDTGHVKAS